MTPIKIISAVFLLWIGFVAEAWAYLDPGSGSMLLQLLLGGVAGIVMLLKLYWHRILVFLGIKKDAPSDETPGASEGGSDGE